MVTYVEVIRSVARVLLVQREQDQRIVSQQRKHANWGRQQCWEAWYSVLRIGFPSAWIGENKCQSILPVSPLSKG